MRYQLRYIRVSSRLPRRLNRLYPTFAHVQKRTHPARVIRTGSFRGQEALRSSYSIDAVALRSFGRLAQLVARFLHTEEVISSSLVSPTAKTPGYPGVFSFQRWCSWGPFWRVPLQIPQPDFLQPDRSGCSPHRSLLRAYRGVRVHVSSDACSGMAEHR